MNRKLIRTLSLVLALFALLALSACAAEPEPHALLALTVLEVPEGTVTLDKSEIWEKEEKLTLLIKPNEGYVPERVDFLDATGLAVTASYPELEDYVLQPDGSYKVEFAPAQYFHVHEAGDEACATHEEDEHVTQARVKAFFISESAPTTTVAEIHPHSQVTVFPERCEPGTNVKVIIAVDKGYEVTYCDHNGTAFPVDDPLSTYSDAEFDYVSFSFYIKDADEVVTYEIKEK